MKKISLVSILTLTIGLHSAACEFTIFNDHVAGFKVIYVSLNETLANVVSKETLKEKGAIRIKQHAAATTPFTKWFDIYVPRKADGQYERAFRVNMGYCSEENDMTLSQIKSKQINMKRFKVADFSKHHETKAAHTLCDSHDQACIKQEKMAPHLSLEKTRISKPEGIYNPYGDKILIP